MLKGKKFDAFALQNGQETSRSLMQSASPNLYLIKYRLYLASPNLYFAIYRLGEVVGSRLH